MILRLSLAAVLCLLAGAGAQAADRHVTVVNGTNETMTQFQASTPDSNTWEEDILGQDTLAPSESVDVNVDDGTGACTFDFRASFDDNTTGEKRGVNVCKVGKFTFTE